MSKKSLNFNGLQRVTVLITIPVIATAADNYGIEVIIDLEIKNEKRAKILAP
ncbi:hypothetical protein ACMZOO_12340 [Catenovulum sp. SX2]|uniref:hypothetical protein n=1 Tax=Catenovulum sp. SX2 TaxID=3398614 RepID=UPI003F82E0FF